MSCELNIKMKGEFGKYIIMFRRTYLLLRLNELFIRDFLYFFRGGRQISFRG